MTIDPRSDALCFSICIRTHGSSRSEHVKPRRGLAAYVPARAAAVGQSPVPPSPQNLQRTPLLTRSKPAENTTAEPATKPGPERLDRSSGRSSAYWRVRSTAGTPSAANREGCRAR